MDPISFWQAEAYVLDLKAFDYHVVWHGTFWAGINHFNPLFGQARAFLAGLIYILKEFYRKVLE